MPKKPTQTKVAKVLALAQKKSGTTLDAIASKLRVSRTAAGSLVADLRRKVKVQFKDGKYYA